MTISCCAYIVRAGKTFALFLFGGLSYGQSFIVQGTIADKDTGRVALRYFRDEINKHMIDTAIIQNGKFQFSGKIIGAEFASFILDDDKVFYFFIEPGVITMSLKNFDITQQEITGSKIQNEYNSFLKSISKEKLETRSLNIGDNTEIDLG